MGDLSVLLQVSTYSITWLYMSVWTYLFYTLGYTPILLYCVAHIAAALALGVVSMGFCVPLIQPHHGAGWRVVPPYFLTLKNALGLSCMFPAPALEAVIRQGALGITKFKHQQRPTFFIYKQLTQLTLHFLRSSPTRTLNSRRSRTFNPHCTPRAYETMHRVHNSVTTANTEVSEILTVCKRATD